jgi:transcriptional regulator with XRE-family HTH domain
LNITLDIVFRHSIIQAGMFTAAQMRAARAMLGIDLLAELAGISLTTINAWRRAKDGARRVIDSLTKVVEALDRDGIELIGDNMASREGGRGVRLKHAATRHASAK